MLTVDSKMKVVGYAHAVKKPKVSSVLQQILGFMR
jgi:hypothetical protein